MSKSIKIWRYICWKYWPYSTCGEYYPKEVDGGNKIIAVVSAMVGKQMNC